MATKKTEKLANKTSEKGLTRYNLAAGILHLGVALILLSLLFRLKVQPNFGVTADWMTSAPGIDSPRDHVTLLNINLGGAIIAFLLLSAIFHFAIISPFFKERYFAGLRANHNYFRWTEYALSSSLMIVAIALLTGFTDFAALIAIFAVNASMILFGALQEKYETPGNGKALPFIMGCMTGIVPWIIIFMGMMQPGKTTAAAVPGFVIVIIATMFIAFNSFAVNQALQYRKVGKWADYMFGERVYITLSFVAKSWLAFQVFSGAIIPALTSQ
ncbi:MAG: heliorhodopsin HeR [Rhodoluna sp.]|nr:heliorhodopsin HeR [Rhodoluna sp.]